MKTALVLGGGGSRGAYEIGVWKAMRELNIQADIVTGTSIGALNGCLYAQNDYQAAYDLWYHLTAHDVTKDGLELEFSMDRFRTQRNKLANFLKQYPHQKGADISPLKDMIHRLLDYSKLMASPIQYGLVATRFPSLERIEITKDGMPKELIEKQILASASCFPAFPMTEINGQLYIDGGYCDNVPVDLAIRLGAERLIVVDLSEDKPTHPQIAQFPNITFIQPTRNLGTILSFDQEKTRSNITLGYVDALRAFGALKGFRYSFRPQPQDQPFFMRQLLLSNASLSLSRTFDENKFVEIITEHTHGKRLHEIDFDYRIAEVMADLLDLPHEQIYTLEQMQSRFKDYYTKDDFHYLDILKPAALTGHENESKQKRQYLVGCIYHQIRNSESVYNELTVFSHIFPKEALCALYLYLLFH